MRLKTALWSRGISSCLMKMESNWKWSAEVCFWKRGKMLNWLKRFPWGRNLWQCATWRKRAKCMVMNGRLALVTPAVIPWRGNLKWKQTKDGHYLIKDARCILPSHWNEILRAHVSIKFENDIYNDTQQFTFWKICYGNSIPFQKIQLQSEIVRK